MKDILVKLKLKNDEYNKGLKDSEKNTESFSKGSAASIKTLAASFVAVTALVGQFKKGLTDLAQETRGIAKVNAVIKATGNAAGVAASDIENWTDQLQKTTEFSQDASRDAAALGLTFKNISKNIFPEVLSLSADMATIVGTDLKGAMMQLSKAIDNPAKQFTALRRSGVSFTNAQEKMIKTMQKAGNVAGAQEVLMKALREQIGGAAQAIGQTWIGTITRAKNAFDDLRKEFLKGLAIGGNLNFLESFIQNQDKVKAVVKKFAYDLTHNTILPEFKALFGEIFELLKLSGKGWGLLWESAIKPILTQVLKGWKMIAAVATTGLKNIRVIFENIGDIAVDVFQIATMQIEIMIAKASAKIKPLLTYVQTYLQTGSFEQASRSAGAETKLGEAKVYRSTMNLANYDLQSGDVKDILNKNMSDLGNRISEIMTENITTPMQEVKENTVATNETIKENIVDATNTTKEKITAWQDAALEAAEKAKEAAEKAANQREKNANNIENIIYKSQSAMEASINFFVNRSIKTFTAMATNILGSTKSILTSLGELGVGGGLFGKGSNLLSGLGIAGAGISLLGSLAGTIFADDEESSSSIDSGADMATNISSPNSPQATITRTGPETEIKHYNITITDSNIMADEEGTMDIARRVLTSMSMIQGASA